MDVGKPVAFLDLVTSLPMYNPDGTRSQQDDQFHWVDIIGYDGDKLQISTWGDEMYIEYGDLESDDFWLHGPQNLNTMIDFTLISVP